MAKIPPGILAWITLVLVESTVAGAMPEYAAAESKKHIGETARVTGKVDFVDAHRRSHILSLGGCEPKMDFYVRVPYGVPGPDLNVTELKGGVITVSEKMEKSEVDDLPFIDVTSTSQIVPHKLQKAQAEVKQEQPVADPPQTNAPAEAPAGEKQTSPHGSYTRPADAKGLPAGTNILGSPAEPGIADVTALVEFTGNGATNKGSGPNGLIFASDGDIYGTTERGGANDHGTVFKMTPAGALSTIVEFAGNAPVNSSGFPMAPLIERRDGDFYGTTSGGGVGPTGENNLDNGTIFKLSRSGVLTTLVRFSCNGATNKGCTPYSGLVEAPNGDFYGTTFSGGSGKAVAIPGFRGFGTIYKMSPAGLLITLYDFSGHVAKGQGGSPWAGLTLGKDRNFYGNTWLGGAGHGGTIFKMTPRGAMTTLVNFSGFKPPNKGGGCVAELVQASDGHFYGTCPIGGGGNGGTVFKMTPSGAFTNLMEFSNNDPKGAQPHAALAEGNDGNLYGTTTVGGAYNYGTIFRVTPTGLFKVLWNFNNPNKIHECQHPGTGPLLKDKEGNFCGTTKWGGRSDWGTVFKLTLHTSDMQASTAPPGDSPSPATPQPAQMEQSRAEAKAGAKKVVVAQLTAQAVQNAQSSNKDKDEVSPESIAEAFAQAYSGADVDALASLYADRVDYTNSGVVSNAAIRKQAQEYFARWPVRQWSLAGPVKTTSMGPFRQKVIFSASYDVSDPQRNKHTSGIAKETLIVVSDASAAMKIVSQKEQISKKGSSQPSEETATSGSGMMWSELSPDKRMLATIRFVPNPDKNWRAFDELKIAVFRQGRDGKPGQILASTAIGGRFLQSAHWSPDSQFLLFTTSPSRGGHGGWHFETFVYCARDHSFRGDLEDVFGNVLAPDFGFESPDIAVLTVSDDQAPSTAGEEPPTKQVKVSLGKVVDKLDRLP